MTPQEREIIVQLKNVVVDFMEAADYGPERSNELVRGLAGEGGLADTVVCKAIKLLRESRDE
jgi:hypothetical protein